MSYDPQSPYASSWEKLLSQPEDQWFDRKSFKIQPKDLAKALVAFANAEGGIIAVGITDRTLDGLPSAKQANQLRQAPHEFTDPTTRYEVKIVDIPDPGSHSPSTKGPAQIYLFHVFPTENVHYTTAGECYLRVGDQTQKLKADDILELRYTKGEQTFDSTEVSGANVVDLNDESVASYAHSLGSSTPIDALKARGLLRQPDRPTVASVLMFGKSPQLYFPNAHIRVLKFEEPDRLPGRQQQLAFDKRFEGTIPQQLEKARETIMSLLPEVERKGTGLHFQRETLIPPDVWLEGLVNAAIHRSYSNSGDHIRFEIFPDKISISSPGRFPGLVDPSKPEEIARFARNPHIARVAAELKIGQELGEGIRRIYSEMRLVGLSDPIYKQTSGSVILTLPAQKRVPASVLDSLPKGAEEVLHTLQLHSRPLGTREVSELTDLSVPTARTALQQLRRAGLIFWHGTSPKDPRATWSATENI